MLYSFWTGPEEISIPKRMIKKEERLRNYQNKSKKEEHESEDWNFIKYLKSIVIMDIDGHFYRNANRVSIAELKKEYAKNKKSITVNVPSLKILSIEKRNIYLKKLTEAGVEYIIFG